MGTQVYNCATKANHKIVCGIDNKTLSNLDCPIYNDFDQINQLADVIVDFSSPTITESLLTFAKANSLPLVICTTGHSKKQENSIFEASRSIPILKSANTSLGVNYFIRLCKMATHLFNEFDVEIIEKHHKNDNRQNRFDRFNKH